MIRRIILGLLFALAATPALAQNITCSNRPSTDNSNACANTRFVQSHVPPGAGAGGTNGQIQYNNAGSFGGFTAGGDAVINTSTGQVDVSKISGIGVTTTGSSTNDILAYNGTGYIHSAITSIINTACTLSPTTCFNVFGYGNVIWWGALCDGTTDDRAAIVTALAAIPSGAMLEFPATSCAVKSLTPGGTNPHIFNLTKPVHISFRNGGGILKSGVTGILFDIQTNGVTIDGSSNTVIDGGWTTTTYNAFDIAISTNNYDNASTPRSYVNVSGIQLTNWGHGGLFLWYCNYCNIQNNIVGNVAYAGIFCGACQTSLIDGNKVYNVWSSTGPDIPPNPVYRADHYGITASTNLAMTVPSLNVTIANNIVINVPSWECYDTHSGQHIIFANNIGIACGVGIAASSPGTVATNVSIVGNQIECIALGSPVYSGSAGLSVGGAGISVAGASLSALFSMPNINGNIVYNCGPDNLGLEGDIGAIYATYVAGLSISDNIIYSPRHSAFALTGDYALGSIIGNTVQGLVAGPAGGTANIFNIAGTNNSLLLGSNYANGSGYNGYSIASAAATNVFISRTNAFIGPTSLYTGSSISYRTDLGLTAP